MPEEVQICTSYLSGKFHTCNCLYAFIFHLIIHRVCTCFLKQLPDSFNVTLFSFFPSQFLLYVFLINGNLCFQKHETLSSEPERHAFIHNRWNKTTVGRETKGWVFYINQTIALKIFPDTFLCIYNWLTGKQIQDIMNWAFRWVNSSLTQNWL